MMVLLVAYMYLRRTRYITVYLGNFSAQHKQTIFHDLSFFKYHIINVSMHNFTVKK